MWKYFSLPTLLLALTLTACGSEASVPARPPIATRFDAGAQEHVLGEGQALAGAFGIYVDWELPRHAATAAFTTPHGEPVDPVDVQVRLSMPSHGHEGAYAKVSATPRADGSGIVDIDHLFPSMEGEWSLEVRAVVAGIRDKAVFAIAFPKETLGRFSDSTHHCH